MQYYPENVYLQDRARLRAETGDVMASCTPADPVFEDYCTRTLGLGQPEWLRLQPDGDPLKLAVACWTDRQARDRLVQRARKGQLERVHPYLGSFHVWALAQLLSRAARRPLSVVAPPPGLARRVNDKTWFASLVTRFLGEAHIPETYQVYNHATLAHVIQRCFGTSPHVVVKLPDSAGGKGNLVLDTDQFAGRSIGAIRARLRCALHPLRWDGNSRLLVSSWEEPVLGSPSAQLWLPPEESGEPPIIEGLYNQMIGGVSGDFLGSAPGRFPAELESEMVRSCMLLGSLLQSLGYVGRCSFDMLLTGESLEAAQLKFLECNGRWGGTSGPMSLMNRLLGDWARQPYATHMCYLPGLEKFSFPELLDAFSGELFDVRSGSGWLVFMEASGIKRSHLNILTLGDDVMHARERASQEAPARLRQLVSGRRADKAGSRARHRPVIGRTSAACPTHTGIDP
jgi:hypothetical protein